MNPFPRLRRIANEDERKKIYEIARAENDGVDHVSHVWTRDGEIVGAASLAVVPCTFGWHRRDKISARDSFHIFRLYESVMEQAGFPFYWTMCNSESPYNEHLKKFGFKPIWKTEIFQAGVGIKEEPHESLPQIPESAALRMR